MSDNNIPTTRYGLFQSFRLFFSYIIRELIFELLSIHI